MEFRKSRTYQNLMRAMQGETQASTKYRIYGAKAREEGHQHIGQIFDETAGNEQEHAELFKKKLSGGELPDTQANLRDAIAGEHAEWTEMYRNYANIARLEGYEEIARLFDGVASIENHHEYRFGELLGDLEQGRIFCKGAETVWICMNCGFLYTGVCAPDRCPVCGYPQGYFKEKCE